MFVKEDSDVTMTSAFDYAIGVLKRFSGRSHQASHYHDILEKLRGDIDRRRSQLLARRRELSTRPVRKMFHLDIPDGDGAISQPEHMLLEEPAVEGHITESVGTEVPPDYPMTSWDDPAAVLDFDGFDFFSWGGYESFLQG